MRNKYTVFTMAVALRSVNNKKILESYSSEASPQYSLNLLKRETYLWKKHINDTGLMASLESRISVDINISF